jgi:hypothetical protein
MAVRLPLRTTVTDAILSALCVIIPLAEHASWHTTGSSRRAREAVAPAPVIRQRSARRGVLPAGLLPADP